MDKSPDMGIGLMVATGPHKTISNKMNKAKTAIAAFLAGFVFLGMLQYQAAWLESQPIC